MAESIARKANAQRVQRHRMALRAAGLRPLQIWVPDTKAANFIAEVKRQTRLVAVADQADEGLDSFLDAAYDDLLENTK